MALTINTLSNRSDKKSATFVDLYLDLQETKQSTNSRNSDVITGNDIVVATDEEAIKNSIRNILLQRRYLIPSFGANLRSYIGQPLTEMGAFSLGQIIDRNLGIYEPRIKVEKILVSPDYDKFEYSIIIIYTFRNFKTDVVMVNAGFAVGDGNLYFIK